MLKAISTACTIEKNGVTPGRVRVLLKLHSLLGEKGINRGNQRFSR
jgi:hypothetical protein